MVISPHKRMRWAFVTVLIGCLSLFAGIITAQDTVIAGCPTGQGYWKNHTEVWPVTELVLGGQTYTQLELIGILNLPVAGDASINLAHQLIAAKLNVVNGTDATAISSVLAQADALLATFPGKVPYGIAPSSTEGQGMVSIGGVLDIFNNGGLTVGCATPTPEVTPEATVEATPEVTPAVTPEITPEVTPIVVPDVDGECALIITASHGVAAKRPAQVEQESTPEPGINIDGGPGDDTIIVVEGPVQEINVNIINIYDIDIVLPPDDPNLTVIQIGDVIRAEGTIDNDCPTIVIVAVTIIFVDIDVFILDGEVWRDPGDCSNGPPPWAPAHGWRRRCEGGGNNSGGMGMGMGMGNGSGSGS
jgi:hypothetical protein